MKDLMVFRNTDKNLFSKAKHCGLEPVLLAQGYDVEFDRAVFVEPGISIPWDMVPHGMHFLERWDAAAPLWRYGVTLAQLGTPADQRRTEKIVRDLRLLPYSWELLFVKGSPTGRVFLAAFTEECGDGGDKRLAFHRALYRVKPIFCALPMTWLAELAQRAVKDRRSAQAIAQAPGELVRVEVAPGRFVKVYRGTEEKVKQEWAERMMLRHERRKLAGGR